MTGLHSSVVWNMIDSEKRNAMNTGGFIDKGAGSGKTSPPSCQGGGSNERVGYVVHSGFPGGTQFDLVIWAVEQLTSVVNRQCAAIDKLVAVANPQPHEPPRRTKQDLYRACARYVDGEARYSEVVEILLRMRPDEPI